MAITKITTASISDNAVTSPKIPSNAVTTAKIATNAVGSGELNDNSVDAAAIIDGAVIEAKLATNAVTTNKINNGAITNAKLASECVTLAKIEHGTSSNDGKFLRANNGSDPTFESIPAGTTINNQADNRLITCTGTADTLNGEANLTYTGDILSLGGTTNLNGVRVTNTANVATLLQFSANRAANTNTIGSIDAKWNNNHRVASIMLGAGDDTTNKDNGIMQFYTAPDSSTGIKEAMRIRSDGTVTVSNVNNHGGNSGVVASMIIDSRTNGGDCGLYVKGHGQQAGTASPHAAIRIAETAAANNATEMIGLDNVTSQNYVQHAIGIKNTVSGAYGPTYGIYTQLNKNVGAYTNGYSYLSNITTSNSGGAAYHFEGRDNGSARVLMELDGDLRNSNNTYGQLSDVKLKENIVDANSQWNDVKAVKVRNFNFKASTGQPTHRQIGVVAQEIETVSAGLVKTENDIEIDPTTQEGKVTGTTKMVKYSILYMKAFKALQEAMAKIEVLETKVAALEAG